MKTSLVAAFYLFAGLSSVYAGSNPAAEQLLQTANQQRDIFHADGDSFQFELDFTAQLNVPTNGHLSVRWKDKDHWRIRVVLGGFEQIEVHDGEWTRTARNVSFTPLRVQELMGLIHMTEGPSYIGSKSKDRVEGGVHLTCVQGELEHDNHDRREFCIDSNSHDVLSERWVWEPDDNRRELYFDYFEFAGHRYPRRLQLEVNGSRVIKAEVTSLVAAPFDDALLTSPKGALERRHCPGTKPAEAIKKPEFPLIGIQGDSTVALTVLTDGSVGDIQLIARGGQKLDAANLANLKQWKFKPAMCGSEPVVSDITIVTSVRER